MKTILISAHCAKLSHSFFCKSIVDILLSFGYHVDHLDPNNDAMITKYDAVISFNLSGYRKIRKYLKNRKFTHIYMCCLSDIVTDFLYDNEMFDSMIVIRDEQGKGPGLLQRNFVRSIDMPFQKPQITAPKRNNEKSRLLVHTSKFETLFAILPVINRFEDVDIKIISPLPINKKLLNHHIATVRNCYISNVLPLIEEADIVIGDGAALLIGLLHRKQAIVVGKRGLGGLIDENNVEMLYRTGFSGRVGAENGEHIPYGFLEKELTVALQKIKQGHPASPEVQNVFARMHEQTSLNLQKILQASIKQSTSLWETQLNINIHFGLYPVADNQHVIMDRVSGRVLFIVNEDEYLIIQAFKQVTTPMRAFINFQHQGDYFIRFVKQLVNNKILLNHE